MTLQDDFFEYIEAPVTQYHHSWNKRPTLRWYNCYAPVDGRERVIIWVRKPNKDGTFWIWITISFDKISQIWNLIFDRDTFDYRKFYVSLSHASMTPIELLDRGLTAKSSWEENWPVGFKIIDRDQFELAAKIITLQWQ